MEAREAMQARGRGWWRQGLVWSVLGCVPGCLAPAADAQPTVPSKAIAAELQVLAGRAGTIFVGQITSMQRAGGTVEVAFRVEQTVRGTAPATYVLREWAGNWPPGHLRYVLGQRVLAFLYAAGAAGVSSPVHGAEGLVPVIVQGADAPELVDVRRVAASVVRAPGTSLPTEADGALPLADVLQLIRGTAMLRDTHLAGVPIPIRARPPLETVRSVGSGQTAYVSPGTGATRVVAVEPLRSGHVLR